MENLQIPNDHDLLPYLSNTTIQVSLSSKVIHMILKCNTYNEMLLSHSCSGILGITSSSAKNNSMNWFTSNKSFVNDKINNNSIIIPIIMFWPQTNQAEFKKVLQQHYYSS